MLCRIVLCLLCISPLAAKGPVVLVVGTRPEAVKMAPLYWVLKREEVPTLLCSTGQHAELLDEMLTLFGMEPDVAFGVMRPGQDLFYLTHAVLERAKEYFLEVEPSMVVVQGDTTSAMVAALAAFYLKIPVAHVEAGLRTGDLDAPFPEEFNRRVIRLAAHLHFAPTELARSNLLAEGVAPEQIECTGNTVVDALYMAREWEIGESQVRKWVEKRRAEGKKLLLLTAHRRESQLDGGLHRIFSAVKRSVQSHPELAILYPMHPNPRIAQVAEEVGLAEYIEIVAPLPYQEMVYLMEHVDGVLTDSGGVQEEAASLSRPLLVLRTESDRPEGASELVGTDEEKIIAGIERILGGELTCGEDSVYGDGQAAERIAGRMLEYLK